MGKKEKIYWVPTTKKPREGTKYVEFTDNKGGFIVHNAFKIK